MPGLYPSLTVMYVYVCQVCFFTNLNGGQQRILRYDKQSVRRSRLFGGKQSNTSLPLPLVGGLIGVFESSLTWQS